MSPVGPSRGRGGNARHISIISTVFPVSVIDDVALQQVAFRHAKDRRAGTQPATLAVLRYQPLALEGGQQPRGC